MGPSEAEKKSIRDLLWPLPTQEEGLDSGLRRKAVSLLPESVGRSPEQGVGYEGQRICSHICPKGPLPHGCVLPAGQMPFLPPGPQTSAPQLETLNIFSLVWVRFTLVTPEAWGSSS